MTRAADCLDMVLRQLQSIEDQLEFENALNPDHRLSLAEIVLTHAIADVMRAKRGERHRPPVTSSPSSGADVP